MALFGLASVTIASTIAFIRSDRAINKTAVLVLYAAVTVWSLGFRV